MLTPKLISVGPIQIALVEGKNGGPSLSQMGSELYPYCGFLVGIINFILFFRHDKRYANTHKVRAPKNTSFSIPSPLVSFQAEPSRPCASIRHVNFDLQQILGFWGVKGRVHRYSSYCWLPKDKCLL